MGLPMCGNLVKSGKYAKVLAFDKFPERIAMAADASVGASPAKSVEQVAQEADIVFTMLFNTATTDEVYRGSRGLFESAKKGTTFIDSTTIAPAFAKALGEEGLQRGFEMADAPVSGGVTGAQAGTLAFMTGCRDEATFQAKIKPFLDNMGANIFYCGKNGTGSVAKVCNNMALAIQMISVAEALALGEKLGMDAKLLSNVMNKSSARCWSGDTYNPHPGVLENVPSSRDYERGFKMSFMVKDLGLAIENAKTCGADVEFGEKSLDYYKALQKDFEQKDFGFVYEYVKRNKKMH